MPAGVNRCGEEEGVCQVGSVEQGSRANCCRCVGGIINRLHLLDLPLHFSAHTHLCSDPALVPVHHAQRLGVGDIPDLDLARLQQSRGERGG